MVTLFKALNSSPQSSARFRALVAEPWKMKEDLLETLILESYVEGIADHLHYSILF